MTDALTPSDILNFWFAPEMKAKWFASDEAFDAELRRRFEPALQQAKRGDFNHWAATPEGAVALVILLDQFPRNIYRGTPEAFAADPLALELAKQALAAGFDDQVPAEQRHFLYLPLMHSEALTDQEQGVVLFEALGAEEALDYMRRHRDVIARFGRFPHRNAILGRTSTPEEIEFLKQPGSSF